MSPPTRVLLVCPPAPGQSALAKALAGRGYEVLTAASADETLELLRRQRLACVLLDLELSGGDAGLIGQVLQADPTVALLVVSTTPAVEAAVSCLQAGALDYLALPVDHLQLDHRLRRALACRAARRQQARADRLLRDELTRLTLRLWKTRAGAARSSLGTLEFLVHMMEVRDRYLAGHSLRVAQLAASMAAELGRSEEQIEEVRTAGRLHDIGMLCIGEGILSKTGPLTPEELDRVRQHVVIGDEILAHLPRMDTLRAFVRSHHERWDGEGYPDGLSGEAIPWGSRLIGAAEVYDALTTSRPYRAAVRPDHAMDQMGRMSGTAVSPEAFEALATIVTQRRALVFVDSDHESRLGSLETNASMEQARESA